MAGDADLEKARWLITDVSGRLEFVELTEVLCRLVRRVEEGDSAIAAYAKELHVEANQVKLMVAITTIVKERDFLKARTRSLVDALESAKMKHLIVDGDCWFSCPKSGESCSFDDEDVCRCGTDAHNAKIEKALEDFRAG